MTASIETPVMYLTARAGRQEATGRAAQDEASQSAADKGTRIYVDAVSKILWRIADGMAVNDDLAGQSTGRSQELFAYPQQVPPILLFQGTARPDSGMHEHVVPFGMAEHAAAQEVDMVARHRRPQSLPELGGGSGAGRQSPDRHSIGKQGFQATIGQPGHPVALLVQELEHGVLVVSHQEDAREIRPCRAKQRIDDATAFGAAIDVVAEEYELTLPVCRMPLGVGGDLRQQGRQQVQPAMDVADGIDRQPVRDTCRRRLRRPATEPAFKHDGRPTLGTFAERCLGWARMPSVHAFLPAF